MLRFEVSEHDRALPVIDLADDVVVIGSGSAARIRLPADTVRPEHLRIEGQTWTLLAEARLGGMTRAAGDSGSVGHGMILEVGPYRVRISASPAGTAVSPPQRTESLARELMRSLLGEGAAPSLEIERGPHQGAKRDLPPPEATLVIGRGDEATWVIVDEDLSRVHAELRRGWDGVTVVDLGSKNGTRIDGAKIGPDPVELHDGAALALGAIVFRFRDPAERHLRGESVGEPPAAARAGAAASSSSSSSSPRVAAASSPWSFVAYAAIAVVALAALIWILAT
jgi:FHA domain-containing protein